MSDATLRVTMKPGGTASFLIFVLVCFAPGFAASSESSNKGSAVTLSDNDLDLVTAGGILSSHMATSFASGLQSYTDTSIQANARSRFGRGAADADANGDEAGSLSSTLLATDDVLMVTGSADSIAAGHADTATRNEGPAVDARRVDVDITWSWAAARGDFLHDAEATTEGAAQGDLVFSRNFARDRTGPSYEVSRSLSHLHLK